MAKIKKEKPHSEPQSSGISLSRMRASEAGKIIGNNLKSKRISHGLTQTALADLVNLTYQQIQKYESGANTISAILLYDLSLIFDVPVSNFYQGLEIRGDNKSLAIHGGRGSLTNQEVSKIIHAFSIISNKNLRQALIKTIACIGEGGKDD